MLQPGGSPLAFSGLIRCEVVAYRDCDSLTMLVTCTDSMGLQEICLIEALGKESLS
jgi:hypothetical protein